MPLIFITGNSAAGKTSVCKELQRRGYEAHDTDDDDITVWRDKTTGHGTDYPEAQNDRTKEWYDQHEWKMSRKRVEEFAIRAKAKPTFLCGSPTNADDMLDLYDKVICLVVDKQTIQHRIATRTDNKYGKAPNELSEILGWHDSFQDRYRNYGAAMIDASRPLDEVVSDVLTATLGALA